MDLSAFLAKIRLRLGWHPDLPDHRDLLYVAPKAILKALPPSVDLTPQCPPIFDQETIGSCTANAISSAHLFAQMAQKKTTQIVPSRLFIYWNERALMGKRYILVDSGAYLRDGFKTIAKDGVCSEQLWPYRIKQFRIKPSRKCYKAALDNQAIEYRRVGQTLDEIKACLAEGFPVVFGFSVYDSMMTEEVMKTGIIPMPGVNDSQSGGHAVYAAGYDDATKEFIIVNSWGTEVGIKGVFRMPYDYLTNADLAADLWTLRLVE